jgi:PAS domain-containing protein
MNVIRQLRIAQPRKPGPGTFPEIQCENGNSYHKSVPGSYSLWRYHFLYYPSSSTTGLSISDYDLQQKSQRLLKYNALSLIGNISDAIITTDKEYRITNWNVHAQEMYGYTEDEVCGQNGG